MNENVIWKIHTYLDSLRNIEFLGDLHLGHKRFDRPRFQKTVKRIARTKSTKVILMGDIVEMATKAKYRVDQELNTNQQMKEFLKLIDPIKEQVIGVIRGNHEERITEVDYLELGLMPHLPNAVYLGYEGFIRVINRGTMKSAIIYVHHGNGGSTRPDYFIGQKLWKLGVQNIADVIAVGHCHQLWKDTWYVPESGFDSDIVYAKPVHICRTGSFLNYPAYAAKAAMGLAGTGTVRFDVNRSELQYV